MFLSRAASLAAVVLLAACQSSTPVSFAKPKAPSAAAMQQALGGTGYAGTATFNAPVVDPNTWSGAPIGTGTFSAASTPPQSGGPQAIAADDNSDPSQVIHYVMVGDLSVGPGKLFGIISTSALSVGSHAVDNVNTFAGIFDGATGDPTSLASSGTVVITSAGATLVGSFNGTLEDFTATPPGCTSNADCATGQICSAGRCVSPPPPPPPPPACTVDADCAAGQVCSSGTCVNAPPPPPPTCVVDADCSSGQVCWRGTCVNAPPPPPPPPPPACDRQGTGAFSGSAGVAATCSALGSGAVSVTSGYAALGLDENGALALMVLDASGTANGAVIPLAACPAASGAVSVSNAKLYSQVNAGAGLTLYAERTASGTVTFTSVAAHTTGTFSLTLSGGGTIAGSFDVR
jgi:Cys-rich repeat protein